MSPSTGWWSWRDGADFTGFGHAAAGLVVFVLSAVRVASRRGARGGGAGTATAH